MMNNRESIERTKQGFEESFIGASLVPFFITVFPASIVFELYKLTHEYLPLLPPLLAWSRISRGLSL